MPRGLRVITALALAITLAGCSVSGTLTPSLPSTEGSFAVATTARQPFHSPDDNLAGLSIRFHPEGFPGPRATFDPERGARVTLRYAPEADPRYPEQEFHDWPPEHGWLPELTGEVVYGQSFTSRYPELSGVQVRVATFLGDLQPGTGRLRDGAPVIARDLPIDGREVAILPAGSELTITGAAEGWARVDLPGDRSGFVDLSDFAEVPAPARVNDADVVFNLFDDDSGELLRAVVVNAADMFDNSHQTFAFDPVPDATDRRFRFELSAPGAVAGRSVAFRYSPVALYDEGFRYENGEIVSGDMIFRPVYADRGPLWEGWLEEFTWAAPVDAFDVRFDPIPATSDRYLEVAVSAGTEQVSVPWSRSRPPGLLPLRVDGWPDAPQGGMVFNAVYVVDVPVGDVTRSLARDARGAARDDPWFFVMFTALLIGAAIWTAWAGWGWGDDGR